MATMAFDAPATLAGNESVASLAIFTGIKEHDEITVGESIPDGDGMNSVEIGAEVAVEPASVEPAAEAEPIVEPVAEDDTFWDEIELLGKLANAERERQDASMEFLSAKESLKEYKDTLAAKETALQRVASEIADLMAGKTLPKKPVEEAAATADGIAAAESEVVEAVDNSWREKLTSDLLTGLKGLGAKKLDAICALAKTVGALEDLRAEASLSFKQFKDVLPDGFGEKVASAIEERLLEASKPATPSCAEQVEPRSSVVESDASEEPHAVVDPIEPIKVITRKMKAAETIAIAKQFDDLRKAVEIENEALSLTLDDCEPFDEEDSIHVEEGFRAFEENLACHCCQCDTVESQRDWMMGWVLAKTKERLLVEAGAAAE